MADTDFSKVPTERLLQMVFGGMPAKEDVTDRSAREAMVPSGVERFGRGMMDFYQGVKQKALNWTDPQAAQQYTGDVNAEVQRYEQGRKFGAQMDGKPDPGVDLARLAGNMATPLAALPGGGAAAGGRLALGALAGGAAGYANFNPVNTESSNLLSGVVGAGVGAGANLVAPVLIDKLVGGVQGLVNRGAEAGRRTAQNLSPTVNTQITNNVRLSLQQQGVDWNALGANVQQAMLTDAREQIAQTGRLNAEQLLRRADIEAVAGAGSGMRGQITRDPAQWTLERNLQKTEMNLPAVQRGEVPSITNRLQSQDAAMRQFGQGVIENVYAGVPAPQRAATPFQASERAAESVRGAYRLLGEEVSEAYNVARASFGAQANIPREGFARRAIETLTDYEDVIPSPIKNRLSEFGIDRMGVTNGTKAFTVEEGDKLLKLINKRYKSADDATKAGLDDLRGALKDSVLELGSGGNDAANAFRQAWGQASQRFRQFEPKPLQSIIGEKVNTANFLETHVLKGNPNDLAALRRVMTQGGDERAWNDVRAQAWQWAMDKATQGGRQPFSGAKLDDALRQIGDDRLRVLFPTEFGQIQTLRRGSLAMTNEPGFSAPNRSNTTPALMGQLIRYGNRIPGVNMITGPMAQEMESSATQSLIAQALSGQGTNTAARDAAQAAARARVSGLLAGNRAAYPALLAPAYLEQERR